MRWKRDWVHSCLLAGLMIVICLVPGQVLAQEQTEGEEQEPETVQDQPVMTGEIVVTGSRIMRDPLDELAPIVELGELELERTGLTNLGAALQQLPAMGTAINTKFNVPGNSGFPQDGNGIGAGAVELSLRNVGAKRTLILVDGKRWIAGASASGVPSAVDLNTIPASVIEKIEVLQDGASAIYGSDAIGGVVNIITNKNFEGFRLNVQTGGFLSYNDGQASELSGLWGGGNDKTHFTVAASYVKEEPVWTADRAQSAYPSPFATSCDAGGCSSFTPQGRFVLGPAYDYTDVTLNNGVLNDGGANIPQFDPLDPTGGDFHAFGSADRFNFNGPGYNYLQTPNERINLYLNSIREITTNSRFVWKAIYTNRQSSTQAAPEPLCFGAGCGNRIADNIVIDADQIYNPFGIDLSVADGSLEFFGRRPLESGPRIFEQNVNTFFTSAGFEGEFAAGERDFYWDVTASYGDNSGFQQKYGAHNMARLAVALGDPAVCAATPNCVPFNLFGGQGPDGNGSITPEMLNYVGYIQRDYSEQTLTDFAGNITGDLWDLATGQIAFAAGIEYRKHAGSFEPDPVAASGETAGIPSAPTSGEFDVLEYYGELNIPLKFDSPIVDYLELNLAARMSDYSTFGSEPTYKVGVMWRPIKVLSLRGAISTGIRAPGIGELFGGAAREDFTFLDPCADVLGTVGTGNGGRDSAQPQYIIDNCAALGIPVDLAQLNPQLSAVSAGNENLVAETSDNYSYGVVYSPTWDSYGSLTASVDYYSLTIDDAVQGRDPSDVINACVETLDPFFCDAIDRTDTGRINLVDNQLQNIGRIDASGWDVGLLYMAPQSSAGQFDLNINMTFLENYTEFVSNPDGSFNEVDRTGTITNETFQRAYPELKVTSALDWRRDSWGGALVFRYVSGLDQPSGNRLASRLYTDLQARYEYLMNSGLITLILGINNIMDEDPSVCDSCGSVNMSPVVHDLPGRMAYVRMSLRLN